ncbi:MAG: hypothetical protein ACR2RF_07450, partial [Geminicoccaceae bacterium]
MHVQQSQASTALASLRATNAAQRIVDDAQAEVASTAKSQAVDKAVTGAVSVYLSPEAIEHLKQTSQEGESAVNGVKDTASPGDGATGTTAVKENRLFEELVNNPAFAKDHARAMGAGYDMILIPNEIFDTPVQLRHVRGM